MTSIRIDPAIVLRGLDVPRVDSIEAVSGGWDTEIWRVEADGQTHALRVFGTGRQGDCRHEVLVMEAAARGGIPVPQPSAHHLGPDYSAMLLPWVAGRPLLQVLGSEPTRARELGIAFGRMHARIHAVLAPSGLLQRPYSWIEWAGPEEEELCARLRALPLRHDALLHLDYHPLNVMVDGGRVTGVLDWTNAAAGDPRADLARTLGILELAPRPVFPDQATSALLDGWRQGYGWCAPPEDGMALFYAWAGAVMLRDLEPKLGKPGVQLQRSDLDRVREWTAVWKGRAGLTGV